MLDDIEVAYTRVTAETNLIRFSYGPKNALKSVLLLTRMHWFLQSSTLTIFVPTHTRLVQNAAQCENVQSPLTLESTGASDTSVESQVSV